MKILKLGIVKIIAFVLLLFFLVILLLQLGVLLSSSYEAWRPDYPKEDISEILKKDELSDEDYACLLRQTGLTKLGIDGLRERGLNEKILKIQEKYFEEQNYFFYSFAPFTGYLKRDMQDMSTEFCYLENGDILYSKTTYVSFFEIGHSSMVIDGERGVMAQASGYKSKLKLLSIATFSVRPTFVVLRVKGLDEDARESVASYVKSELLGAEYSAFAGIFGDKAKETLSKTQCAHFIWYSYMKYGVDLDSNGGKLVLPKDIVKSENVSIVQIFGIDPEKILH